MSEGTGRTQSRDARDVTPLDIVLEIGKELHSINALHTLSSLSLLSKSTYVLLSPILYRDLTIDGPRSDSLFDMVGQGDGDESSRDGDESSDRGEEKGDDVFFSSRVERRIWVMGYTETLYIRHFPSELVGETFERCLSITPKSLTNPVSQAGTERTLFFPRIQKVEIGPYATDVIRTYAPKDYTLPHIPPFLDTIARISHPTTLIIHFKKRPFDINCNEGGNGSYNFVNRLNHLRTIWTSLETLQVYGPVAQVLPSFPGVQNIYHFTSSEMDTGVHWTFRAWQVLGAIKNVFRPGLSGREALDGTSWRFCNPQGHVLASCKDGSRREDVPLLIWDHLAGALHRELPLRAGLGEKSVEEVMSRVSFVG